MPGLTVCFDALETAFSLDVLVEALDELMGKQLRKADSGARMVIMDWFHAAQRDYAYLSITSPPPPPISQILKLSLERSLAFALARSPSRPLDIPDLGPVLQKLTALRPSPGLEACLRALKGASANVLIITNGAKATTQGYVDQASLGEYVDRVQSCDEVGLSKPFAKVYEMAHAACGEVEGERGQGERWFVAAHLWDLGAARKAGFKTGYVLSEHPPSGQTDDGKDKSEAWWEMFGGRPDIVVKDLAAVGERILAAAKKA